jgi:signal transduction histidine kinase
MTRIKEFFRQRVLWVGLLAVLVPLLINLVLQYRSLVELESTMPKARQTEMRDFLQSLTRELMKVYRTGASETLNVPASAFARHRPQEIVQYFEEHPFRGARQLFVGTPQQGKGGYGQILFLNSERHVLEECNSVTGNAATAASANWMAMSLTGTVPKQAKLTCDERDPKNRIIVKPIVDESTHIVGVAGMVLDEEVFKSYYLPKTIKTLIPSVFPEHPSDVIVTLHDNYDRVLYSNQKFEGKPYEVWQVLPFVFMDYFPGVRMRQMTEEQWARRTFITNLSLLIVTTLILIGGIVFALRAASRAMKLSEMKSDFVSNVSHELRTPLASIRVFGEFLRLGRVNESKKVEEYGDYIERESRRLTQLINNILDFSKIESGQKTYEFAPGDIRQVIDDTLKTFQVRFEQSGFTIDFEAPPEPLPAARFDADSISQALINLLDNAVKYSGDSRQINVRLSREANFVTIAVTDHGIGIKAEDQEKIFDKFYRVCTGLVHDVKGSGLGLAIVKHIVEAHNGRLKVESEPGHGSTFTIFLPLDPVGELQSDDQQRLGSEGTWSKRTLGSSY